MKKILIALLLTLFSSQALAQESSKNDAKNDEVKTFINNVGNGIIEIAKEKNLSEKQKKDKIITIIDNAIDSKWIARFVLGRNYRMINIAQKDKFTTLYRSFMINTYGPKFKDYDGRRFTVTSVTKQGRFYIAKAEFVPKNSNIAILVNFRVKERNKKLAILDFITEGISLIETQRSEFNSAISQKGMDNFLDRLETRVKKLKKD